MVHSQNRQKPHPHLAEIKTAAEQQAEEIHFYLTDYRSLYVALIDGVVDALPPVENMHVPGYYAEREFKCDFWFRLRDIRRLVVDDTLRVGDELRKLRNVHYNDRPVALYGGMVDMPLVVTRGDGTQFFADDVSVDGKLWAEIDREAGSGLAALERDLRDNRFGHRLWGSLDSGARTLMAIAERDYREHHASPDFVGISTVANFAAALEAQVNATLRQVVGRLKGDARFVNIDGDSVDLTTKPKLMFAGLERAIGGEKTRGDVFSLALDNGRWFTEQLPPILNAFKDVRNRAVHGQPVTLEETTYWREQLIGVGCTGVFVELAKTKVR